MENILPETQKNLICPSCRAPVSATENFCPHCGAELKEQRISGD